MVSVLVMSRSTPAATYFLCTASTASGLVTLFWPPISRPICPSWVPMAPSRKMAVLSLFKRSKYAHAR